MLFIGLAVRAQEPMNVDFQNSAQNRWLNKETLTMNVLDNMEDQVNWIPFTGGAISLVDSRTDSMPAEEAVKYQRQEKGTTFVLFLQMLQ